ncbi:MAG: PHB depolymerase family esterase [Phycisphaerales bacterium]
MLAISLRVRALRLITVLLALLPGVCAGQGVEPPHPSRPARPNSTVFDVGRERAQRAAITLGETMPELDEPSSLMLRQLAGVLADLRGRDLEALRACIPPNPMLGDSARAERVCTVHLFARGQSKRVAILQAADGNIIAAEIDPPEDQSPPVRAELRRDSWLALFASLPAYRGPYDPALVEQKAAEVFQLDQPYLPARWTIDQETLSARFLGGRKTSIDGSPRELSQEKFFGRLPSGYDPRSPAGLLVWVNAGPDGRPPKAFQPALDELGLVCIGAADSGNNRLVSTRYQLALDAVATASARYHIDPRRVYITGFSGGGRVSSMLQGCFPEVFTGAVPIGGLSFYDMVPRGTGQFYPAGYARPPADLFKLLKTRRMAGVTGQRDFNQLEMQQATELYRRDHLQVRLFERAELRHELPKPDHFIEAISWVDEPYQKLRDTEKAAAAEAFRAATARGLPDTGAIPGPARKLLVRVTEAGPWTEEAWKAVELLKR